MRAALPRLCRGVVKARKIEWVEVEGELDGRLGWRRIGALSGGESNRVTNLPSERKERKGKEPSKRHKEGNGANDGGQDTMYYTVVDGWRVSDPELAMVAEMKPRVAAPARRPASDVNETERGNPRSPHFDARLTGRYDDSRRRHRTCDAPTDCP